MLQSLRSLIASITGGDLYEIVPAEPYKTEDLNYNERSSRSTKEQNDKSARPAIGIGMTVLVILHQILNRKWYSVFFKGKYNPYRLTTMILNILLLLGFALTAFCGMSMSGHAVPFLYGMAPMQFTRRIVVTSDLRVRATSRTCTKLQ